MHLPKTLLAVDDSATMRKVLEITFAGEDFKVVTADGVSGALARMNEDPVAALIDASLGADEGYALAKQVRAKSARIAIVLLASRYAPYDPSRGREAGVDDSVDKPFDTQTLIDKVKKAVVARETGKTSQAQAPAPVAAAPAPSGAAFVPLQRSPIAPAAAARASFATQRTHTLSFEGAAVAPPAATGSPAISRTVPSGLPVVPQGQSITQTSPLGQPPGSTHAVPSATRGAEPIASAASGNGQFAGKLAELGLTSAQVDAVLALSREVVERVVWEVVPQLAETMIREEIKRLTKEG
jgi:CheY-like chemotaxis protein